MSRTRSGEIRGKFSEPIPSEDFYRADGLDVAPEMERN